MPDEPLTRQAARAAYGWGRPKSWSDALALLAKAAEPPNAISYEPGQEFSVHSDYIDPRVPDFQAELERFGQRKATIVTYLNEEFVGGETLFPDANVKLRGRTGDAIVFVNVLGDGSPDYNTKHCGLPPTHRRKWVLSQWIRSKAFPYAPQNFVA